MFRSRNLDSKLAAHAAVWNLPSSVEWMNVPTPFLYWYERYLLETITKQLAPEQVRLVHVIGCGTGREVPMLRSMFPEARIIASDIAERMIEVCQGNLARWGCEHMVEFECCPASALRPNRGPADIVFAFNNVLTYVTPDKERKKTLDVFRSLLRSDGFLVGVVHHRWARLLKSGYFGVQALANIVGLSKLKPGDRIGKMEDQRVLWHYYTAPELRQALDQAGFKTLEIRSLWSLARLCGEKHHPLTGDNNLTFIARAI